MSQVNNKRIAQNTIFLYIRMIVIMLISLYTIRAVLQQLGIEDYGIYNVVGGVVSMFSFLNGTLATSSQRYFSMELANGSLQSLRKQFNLNLTVFGLIALIIFMLFETIGLWFVNTQMTIPENRIFAANVVYQFSIISFILSMISVPYNGLIIAYEKMSAFAYISVIEAFLKLLVVFALTVLSADRLIIYGILLTVVSFSITSSYVVYCKRNLQGAEYSFYWNTKEVKSLFAFTGWHLLGTLANVVRSQGINLLINIFFSPVVNAARAIAFQVNIAVTQLSNNFFVAVKPQMYKSYADNDMADLYKLINFSTWLCYYLVALLAIPLIFNVDFILSAWLHEVPEYASLFTILVLINGLVDSISASAICPALATGNIKRFYLITGTLLILNLPISYVLLRIGLPAQVTMIVSIAISAVAVVVRAALLKGLIDFNFWSYINMVFRLFAITIADCVIIYYLRTMIEAKMTFLTLSIIISTLVLTVSFYLLIVEKETRKKIRNIMHTIKYNERWK